MGCAPLVKYLLLASCYNYIIVVIRSRMWSFNDIRFLGWSI